MCLGNVCDRESTSSTSTSSKLPEKSDVDICKSEKFNFVLVNRYENGNNTIGPHRDDEKDLLPYSSIAMITFGSHKFTN